jgi:predicted flap endonuclease-1-like 5' DNA nuclease
LHQIGRSKFLIAAISESTDDSIRLEIALEGRGMSNTTLIIATIIAILAIVGLFLLLRKPTQRVSLSDSPPPAVSRPAPAPAVAKEGHGLADSAAAAMLDVSTPVLGIDAHPDLPSDDLTRIKGLGPKAQAVLNGIGIHRYAQLADLDPAQAAEVDARLGAFKGRIFRDRWIEQARYLEQDDIAGFEKEFGKLG